MGIGGRFVVLRYLVIALIVAGWLGCTGRDSSPLPPAEIAKIKAASRAYGEAWLSNDPARVMATLTEDAVIVPSGMLPILGEAAIRDFWWPEDSPPTTVTEFTSTEEHAGGHGDVGFVLGTFTLSFEYDGQGYSNHGTYVSIMKRTSDGSWKISHRTWSDAPRE